MGIKRNSPNKSGRSKIWKQNVPACKLSSMPSKCWMRTRFVRCETGQLRNVRKYPLPPRRVHRDTESAALQRGIVHTSHLEASQGCTILENHSNSIHNHLQRS